MTKPANVPPESQWQIPASPDIPGPVADRRTMSEAQDVAGVSDVATAC